MNDIDSLFPQYITIGLLLPLLVLIPIILLVRSGSLNVLKKMAFVSFIVFSLITLGFVIFGLIYDSLIMMFGAFFFVLMIYYLIVYLLILYFHLKSKKPKALFYGLLLFFFIPIVVAIIDIEGFVDFCIGLILPPLDMR